MTILNVKMSNCLYLSSCCLLKEKAWKFFKLHSLGKRMAGEGPGTKKSCVLNKNRDDRDCQKCVSVQKHTVLTSR
jgi:hypothetical protein